MFDIKISGTGIYLPPRKETSEELVTKINKPVDWIHQKAGVFERRVSNIDVDKICLLYTSPSPRDRQKSRMPSSA